MKINRIEFENFRNFRERGHIDCSTDGRITVIYGENGDGKTTLHQLFQWVFYGQVHFNKTTSDELYNLELASKKKYGDVFDVYGCIDFEHEGQEYSLSRTAKYKMTVKTPEKISEEVNLTRMDNDYNWKPVDKPKEIIEKFLPSGLSEYFFFDGESMVADLKVKGKESANKLKKSLYSMFDLDILESSISHIGDENLKTTILGKLYLNKGPATSGTAISSKKAEISNTQNTIERLKNERDGYIHDIETFDDIIKTSSEKIGQNKSKEQYEKDRARYASERDLFLENAKTAEKEFGDTVYGMFPRLLVAKAVIDAQKKIRLQIENDKLPDGLNKVLIDHLLSHDNGNCICGRTITEAERIQLKHYLELLPPKSYSSLYGQFKATARSWGEGFDKEKIEKYISNYYNNTSAAQDKDRDIRKLDEEEKNSPDIEELVSARADAEDKKIETNKKLDEVKTKLTKYDALLRKQKRDFDELTNKTKTGALFQHRIDIMKAVRAEFEKRLDEMANHYSQVLQEKIQGLIDEMSSSKRSVSVSKEFAVRVFDSYNNESKSEGQFAVMTFAYIGGILKLLDEEAQFANKEYPLVLDGPFSKLDATQRNNVINAMPTFAKQVIVFSKDDLSNVIAPELQGRIWTLKSNEEKNVAEVKEGFLWK